MRLFSLILAIILVLPVRAAVADTTETVTPAPPTTDFYRFRPAQLITPGAMLAAGIVGVYAFHGARQGIQNALAGSTNADIDRYLQYLPAAGYLGLGFIPGMPRRGDFRDRLMAGVTAYVVMAAVTNALKHTIREERPDASDRRSFPSGHTATAFTGAELMRIEYGNLVGTAGYAVAIASGALRVVNNRHWVNDVLGGAAIGILSARIAYWLLPFERRLFRLDRKKGGPDMAVMPIAGQANGIALSLVF